MKMPIEHSSQEVITSIEPYALVQKLPEPTQTSWGRFEFVSILMVRVRTESGLEGVGEALARFAPKAHAELVNELLAPRLIGQPLNDISNHWISMSRAYSGRPGGVLIEAISAIDIALWDLLGKLFKKPISALLGGATGGQVPVYGASIPWSEITISIDRMQALSDKGFQHIKAKIGGPADHAIKHTEMLAKHCPEGVTLSVDANWAFDRNDASLVADCLAANKFLWFEEPLHPDDEDGYIALSREAKIPLALGESNYTAAQSRRLLEEGVITYLQPNVTRTGGISETWKSIKLAESHGALYAPHVGMSGIVCEAASLQLARAADNLACVEAPATANLFRSEFCDLKSIAERAKTGSVSVPDRPGLGISVDWDAIERMTIK